MNNVRTQRLLFRPINKLDTLFIYDIYNTVNFKKFAGDKNLNTLSDAENYISSTLSTDMDDPYGMKILEVETGEPIGICGLVNRSSLEGIDLGYGLHPDFEGKGYAYEAAEATLRHAREHLKLKKVLAITTSDNIRCIKLLAKMGFNYEGVKEHVDESTALNLYSIKL